MVGNILKVENQLSIIRNALGGASSYEYQYDNLNRLTLAKGNYTGELTSASYELKMSYNNLNSITKKELNHLSGGVQKGYTLDYSYNNPAHPHAPSQIMEMGKPKARTYQYDGNGNPVYYEESKSFRAMVWDEENRLRGINDNGKLHLYTYDHTGERAVKSSGESSTVVTNGLTSAVITHMDDYTAYVNPYFVVQKGKFTKHYFEGSSRIVSKLGEGTFVHKNTGIMAGGIDYIRQNAQMQEARDNYIRGLKVPPGPPTQHGIYASPEWTGQPYPSLGWQNIRQDQEPPEGWPRPPKFNEPGDVPGPPVQYGDPITPQTVKAGYGFVPNGIREKNLYFYHPDHLGSSSYITDREGRITQHTEYIAFGEVLFEEHSTNKTMPYLFNGKELDQETNLTYFGARYLDMKTSLWLNTDPLSGYNPTFEHEHYIDGQHNSGVFNPMNLNTYGYTYQNPILYIDPNGKQVEWSKYWEDIKEFVNNPIFLDAITNGGYSRGKREIEFAKTNPSTMEWAMFQIGENAIEIKSDYYGGYNSNHLGKKIKNAHAIAEGKKFEIDELAKSIAKEKKVIGKVRLVPQNGKGNVKGNRTDTDQLISNNDGTYTIIETKRSASTPLSRGQNAAKKHVEKGNGIFEVRSDKGGLRKEQQIKVKEYKRVNKYD